MILSCFDSAPSTELPPDGTLAPVASVSQADEYDGSNSSLNHRSISLGALDTLARRAGSDFNSAACALARFRYELIVKSAKTKRHTFHLFARALRRTLGVTFLPMLKIGTCNDQSSPDVPLSSI